MQKQIKKKFKSFHKIMKSGRINKVCKLILPMVNDTSSNKKARQKVN